MLTWGSGRWEARLGEVEGEAAASQCVMYERRKKVLKNAEKLRTP